MKRSWKAGIKKQAVILGDLGGGGSAFNGL